jgi:hypothetical protein
MLEELADAAKRDREHLLRESRFPDCDVRGDFDGDGVDDRAFWVRPHGQGRVGLGIEFGDGTRSLLGAGGPSAFDILPGVGGCNDSGDLLEETFMFAPMGRRPHIASWRGTASFPRRCRW